MKLLELFNSQKTLFHYSRKVDVERLKKDGKLKLNNSKISLTKDPKSIKGHFGEILLEISIDKLKTRGANLLEIKYEFDWLLKCDLLRYVSGENADHWNDWVDENYPEAKSSERKSIINNELNELYGFENEVIALDLPYLYLEDLEIK